MVREDLGVGLTDAVRMTRTLNLYTYREASRANYAANSDIVEGWYWLAKLDDRTCVSCVAQHGTQHPLTETLNDHHNGRCAPIPAIKGLPSPIEQTGEQWFEGLSEAEQRRIMGDKKWEALRDGKFALGDVTGTYDDPVYGPMRRARTLKELEGDN
jgi:hypothetical protein